MNKGKAPFKMESESPEGRVLTHVPHMHHSYHLWQHTLHTPAGRILLYIPQQEEGRFSRRLATTQPMRNCCNSTNEKPPQPRILALLQ